MKPGKFVNKWFAGQLMTIDSMQDLSKDLDSVISEAIAEHEEKKGKLITDAYEKGWNIGFEQGKKHQAYQEGGEG